MSQKEHQQYLADLEKDGISCLLINEKIKFRFLDRYFDNEEEAKAYALKQAIKDLVI